MARLITLLAVSVLFAANAAAEGRDALPRPNWHRAAAAEAVDMNAARQSLASLYRLAREGRDAELLEAVKAIAIGQARPDPERDFILFTLARSLGDLGPAYVGPETLEWLSTTRSRTRVPHEESANAGVPMYNIRAAAHGALADWNRFENEGPSEGRELVLNVDTFTRALLRGGGNVTLSHIRQARMALTPEEIEVVLMAVPSMPDSSTASLVVAELADGGMGITAVRDFLFELLEHPELGATAALALSRSNEAAVLERLAVAAEGNERTARRAALAIETRLTAEGER